MNKLKSFKDQIANFEEKKLGSNLQLSWGQNTIFSKFHVITPNLIIFDILKMSL